MGGWGGGPHDLGCLSDGLPPLSKKTFIMGLINQHTPPHFQTGTRGGGVPDLYCLPNSPFLDTPGRGLIIHARMPLPVFQCLIDGWLPRAWIAGCHRWLRLGLGACLSFYVINPVSGPSTARLVTPEQLPGAGGGVCEVVKAVSADGGRPPPQLRAHPGR